MVLFVSVRQFRFDNFIVYRRDGPDFCDRLRIKWQTRPDFPSYTGEKFVRVAVLEFLGRRVPGVF